MPLKKGDKVKVDYTGTLDDGTVFDSSSKHGKPLEFKIGEKQVIPGFEKAVMGLKKGQEKTVKLKSAEAYGDRNPKLIRKIPKEQMPKDKQIKAGMILVMTLPNGAQLPAKIAEVTDKEVTLDLNHPLAGKNLNFKLKLSEVSK